MPEHILMEIEWMLFYYIGGVWTPLAKRLRFKLQGVWRIPRNSKGLDYSGDWFLGKLEKAVDRISRDAG